MSSIRQITYEFQKRNNETRRGPGIGHYGHFLCNFASMNESLFENMTVEYQLFYTYS